MSYHYHSVKFHATLNFTSVFKLVPFAKNVDNNPVGLLFVLSVIFKIVPVFSERDDMSAVLNRTVNIAVDPSNSIFLRKLKFLK